MSLFNHEFHHQKVVEGIVGSAPASVKGSVNDIVQAALNMNIPWLLIAKGLGTMFVGGFSPAAIAAGLAIIFQGLAVPTALAHLTGPNKSTVAPTA